MLLVRQKKAEAVASCFSFKKISFCHLEIKNEGFIDELKNRSRFRKKAPPDLLQIMNFELSSNNRGKQKDYTMLSDFVKPNAECG